MFGDGEGAVVLGATDDPRRGIQWMNLGADERYADALAQEGRVKPGMKVAMVAFESGFTWGSASVVW